MTGTAWILMLITWAVVGYFSVRFFWKVYKNGDYSKGSRQDNG